MKTQSKRGLNSKVNRTVTISCLISVGVLASVFFNVRAMLALQEHVAQAQLRISRFNHLTMYMVDMETGERGFMLSGEMGYLDPYNLAEAEFEKYARETAPLLANEPKLLDLLTQITALKKQWIEGPAIQEMLARRKMTAGRITYNEFVAAFKESSGKSLTDKIRSLASDAIHSDEERIASYQAQSITYGKRIVWCSILALLSVFSGFGLIAFVARKLSRSIQVLISDLKHVSAAVRDAAGQVAKASDQLSSASERQARSIQVTASSIEEMTQMANKTTTNAQRSETIVTASNQVAARGKQSTEEMIEAIEELNVSNTRITQQVEESNQSIEGIVDVISEIGNKAKVINEIVFQTKLLSFNASVEAARAGEHGKGFSVVAEEVGSLARTSGEAAREIDLMLLQGLEKVRSVIEQTKAGVGSIVLQNQEKVATGTKVARQCGDVLQEILTNVTEVQGSVSEISTAMAEQSAGVSEINRAIQEFEELTNQNSSLSVNTSKSAKELLSQSERLSSVVDSLSQEIHGCEKASQEMSEMDQRSEAA